MAERIAEGRRASAITRRRGAEKRRREMSMLIKKNAVLMALNIIMRLCRLSSLDNPILLYN